jgi:c-di-GMP-specific phosphodiesterase
VRSVLLFGGTGFIGNRLIPHLESEGWRVTSLKRGGTLRAVAKLLRPQDLGLTELLSQSAGPVETFNRQALTKQGVAGMWRGRRLADGLSFAGVITAPEIEDGAVDQLTGLLNRPAFIDAVDATLADAEGRTLVVGDLARARRLNEALGYDVADRVLRILADRLTEAFGAGALPARIANNTFVCILDEAEVTAAERFRAALEQPIEIGDLTVHPAIVVATVVQAKASNLNAHDLLGRAEALLSQMKSAQRILQSHDTTEPVHDSLTRLGLEDDLRSALRRGELEPYFQPIIRLDDGALAGFEALARWRHPRRGLLPPDDFLPLAAETGLMGQLGLVMARSAARQIGAWRLQGLGGDSLFVSVNLTTSDLQRATLVEEVREIITSEKLPANALKLEITEGEVMRDPDQAAELLKALKAVGATLSLDDFGMGFSSLSWLARLPISGLKIDRYFTRTMAANEGSAKIVRSVISLAQDFDLEVVAEGVETAAMAETLKDAGCHYGQGFGYAPPMSAEEALVYIIEHELDRR